MRQLVAGGYAGYVGCDLTVTGDMTVDSSSYVEARYGGFWNNDATFPYVTHGGASGFAPAAVTTDSILAPYLPAGGKEANERFYAGGGVVKLTVGGTLDLNGVASAAGFQDSSYVDLDVASPGGTLNFTVGSLTGGGSISAVGGVNTRRMGTGGGRVAIRLTDTEAGFGTWPSRINAYGRSVSISSSYAKSGSAGTIYLQTAADGADGGTVIVRNDNNANNPIATPIPATGTGADVPAALAKARLVAENWGRVALTADLRLASADIGASSGLDLAGKTLTLKALSVAGSSVGAGTYAAADLASQVSDSSAELTGRVVVLAQGTVVTIR